MGRGGLGVVFYPINIKQLSVVCCGQGDRGRDGRGEEGEGRVV